MRVYTVLFTLKVIFTGRYFLLLLKYSYTVLRTALLIPVINNNLWLKECFLNSSLELFLYSLRLCPLNLVVVAFWNN